MKPHAESSDLKKLLLENLQRATTHLGATGALLIWEDADEPWLEIAHWDGSTLRVWRESPGGMLPLVAHEMADADFHASDASLAGVEVTRWARAESEVCSSPPVNISLTSRFQLRQVLATRVRGELANGRLFLLASAATRPGDLATAVAAADRVARALDLFLRASRLPSTIIFEERQRLSHELHDGVLQSLTGIAFKLKSVESSIATDPAAAVTTLRQVQRLLLEEQREIRVFVMGLRERDASGIVGSFGARFEQLIRRVESVWGVTVNATIALQDAEVSSAREHEILRIVQEAVVNAARHGGATVVNVAIQRHGDAALRVTVEDNGHGFSFKGHYNNAALRDGRLGPVTLKARVRALAGELDIRSEDWGARLEIMLPLQVPAEQES